MALEDNKTLVRHFYEALNVGMTAINAAIDQYVAPDVILHDPFQGTTTGVEHYREIVTAYLGAFSEQQLIIHAMIAEDDLVSVLHTHVGKHTGAFRGLPPTGRQTRFDGLEMIRLRDGLVVEFWRHDHDIKLFRQLGFIPYLGAFFAFKG